MVRELSRKSDLLKKFSSRQLQELCDVFGIKKGGSKKDLVRCLERKKSVSKTLLQVLLDTRGLTIRGKIKNIRENFYKNFIEDRNQLMDDIKDIFSHLVCPGLCANIRKAQTLQIKLTQLKEVKNEKIPKEIQKIVTPKQRQAYYAVKNEAKYLSNFSEEILEIARTETIFSNFIEIEEKIKDERISHYLKEATKCYAVKSYDATVVMIARATEYALKRFFMLKGIKYSSRDTLGKLIDIYEDRFQDETSKRVLGKIMEVQNFDRIVGAHDKQTDRRYISKDEADHAWTAIQVILKELLGIKFEPYLE